MSPSSSLAVARRLLLCTGVLVSSISGSQAERACLQDPSVTGRTCDEATCLSLQNDVDNSCKNPPLEKCLPTDGCAQLEAKKQRHIDCYAKRSRINANCWGGGDAGHWQQQIDRQSSIRTCNTFLVLINALCNGCSSSAVIPGPPGPGGTELTPNAPTSVLNPSTAPAPEGEVTTFECPIPPVVPLSTRGAR